MNLPFTFYCLPIDRIAGCDPLKFGNGLKMKLMDFLGSPAQVKVKFWFGSKYIYISKIQKKY